MIFINEKYMQIYRKCIQLSLENLFNIKYKIEHINEIEHMKFNNNNVVDNNNTIIYLIIYLI